MNEANTKRLYREFPNLYCDKDGSPKETLMSYGISCGDGWFDLVYKLSQRLEKIICDYKRVNKDDPKPPRAFQVKEKFGALCFYMSHYTDEIRDVIDEAQQKSHRTCEKCGRPGKLRNENRWHQTLCEQHNKHS